MNSLAIWILLAVPTQECIDRITKENLGKCKAVTQEVHWTTPYTKTHLYEQENLLEPAYICSKVDNPRPLPKEKFLVSQDSKALDEDDCYDVYKYKLMAEKDAPVYVQMMTVFSSSTTIRLYADDGDDIPEPPKRKAKKEKTWKWWKK